MSDFDIRMVYATVVAVAQVAAMVLLGAPSTMTILFIVGTFVLFATMRPRP